MTTGKATRGGPSDGAVPDWARTAVVALLLGLGCHLAQLVSISLRFPPTRLSTIWLPGGPLLAALLLVPPRRWWILLAAGGAGLFAALATDIPHPALAGVIVVLCGSFAAVAAILRGCAGGALRFDRVRHITTFFAVGGLGLPAVAAFGSAAILVPAGWREGFGPVWVTLTLMGVVGLVTVTPVIVVAATGGLAGLRAAPARWWGEAATLGLGVLGVSVAVFGGAGAGPGLGAVWLLYTPLPLLLWAAARFGVAGTSLTLLVVALISTACAVNGRGPFAAHSPADNVLALQLSVLAMGLPLLVLAAVVEEHRRTARTLRASEQDAHRRLTELAVIYRTAPVGLAFVDTDLRFIKVNDQLAEIAGRSARNHIGRRLREVLPAALADELEGIYREVIGKNQPTLNLEIRGTTSTRPGVERTWLASYYPVRDERGQVLGVNTVVCEITAEKQAEDRLERSYEANRDLAGRLIAAQEAERTRIARELHDDLNQRLAALAISLSGLKRRLAGRPIGEIADELGGLQRNVAQLTDDVRRLSHELHPGVLQHAGLAAALEAHCAEFRAGGAMTVTFEGGADIGAVPPDCALCLYRVAQESLRNVARHANARRVRLTLVRVGSALELTIIDDGCGFDPAPGGRAAGLGLISLDERVRLAGGTLRVTSRAGAGTELHVSIPLGGRA